MKMQNIIIKEARLKRGLSQMEVAELTDIPQPTISRAEMGQGDDLSIRVVVAYVRSGLLNKSTVHDLIYSYDLDTQYAQVKAIKCACGHHTVYRIINKVKCVLCGCELC